MHFLLFLNLIFTILFVISVKTDDFISEIDPAGYILYCPCMGRFGNQADHFLGSLGFAKAINRTLVLPPWVEYRQREIHSKQIPFDTYFEVNALSEYHRVMTMDQFMDAIAPKVWPPNERIAFCYMQRESLKGESKEKSCNAKEGNPFGPFWDTFNIDFVLSEFYGPLTYDTHNPHLIAEWNEKYNPEQWPVLAFTGAPASFPVREEHRQLHQYLIWSTGIQKKARKFILDEMNGSDFIAIHLRNGIDWVRACEHIKSSPNLFAAAQCLGYKNEKGTATMDMCLPPKELIVRHLKQTIKRQKKKFGKEIRAVFVASDSNHMIDYFNKSLQRLNVTAFKYFESNPHVDLAILGMADHLIANCISSYSAFAVREREVNGLPTTFWGFSDLDRSSAKKSQKSSEHEEL